MGRVGHLFFEEGILDCRVILPDLPPHHNLECNGKVACITTSTATGRPTKFCCYDKLTNQEAGF